MTTRKQCTECSSYDTERVDTNWQKDAVEETRVCNQCPTQYTVTFVNPMAETDFHGDWSNITDADTGDAV